MNKEAFNPGAYGPEAWPGATQFWGPPPPRYRLGGIDHHGRPRAGSDRSRIGDGNPESESGNLRFARQADRREVRGTAFAA
jgi:hypothetical protein